MLEDCAAEGASVGVTVGALLRTVWGVEVLVVWGVSVSTDSGLDVEAMVGEREGSEDVSVDGKGSVVVGVLVGAKETRIVG